MDEKCPSTNMQPSINEVSYSMPISGGGPEWG
jgi:hypothetical protein